MTRLWLLPNKISYRIWTPEEYATCNPKDSIVEKVPHVICEKCGMDLGTGTDVNSVYAYCDNCHNKNFRPYKYKNLKTELRCLELGEKEVDGMIIPYTYFYTKENTKC